MEIVVGYIKNNYQWIINVVLVGVLIPFIIFYLSARKKNKKRKGIRSFFISLKKKRINKRCLKRDKYYELGNDFYYKNKYDEAIRNFSKAIRNDRNSGYLYYMRASAFINKEQYAKALIDLHKATRLNYFNWAAYEKVGELLKKIGEPERAIKEYSKVIKLGAYKVNAYIATGDIYKEMGQFENSLKNYEAAHGLDDKDAGFFIKRGLLHQSVQNHDKALDDFNEAIKISSSAYSYFNLVVHLIIMNNYCEAMDELLKMMENKKLIHYPIEKILIIMLLGITKKMLNIKTGIDEKLFNKMINNFQSSIMEASDYDLDGLEKWCNNIDDKGKKKYIIDKITKFRSLKVSKY